MASKNQGKFVVVTGGFTRIGRDLAQQCADDGFDLLITADSTC